MSVDENATPTPSPSKRSRAVITAAQKQALIDNLQLEVTERSRKLRAQYALHAQGLRSRLEMRINRIPHSLRSVNVEILIEKYSEQLEPPKGNPLLISKGTRTQDPKLTSHPTGADFASPTRLKGNKRPSSAMAGSDKENQGLDLELPKKRARIISAVPGSSTAAARPNRATSRKVNPSQVLSPKSHNSRTLPQSPVKPQMTPGKSYLARPVPASKAASSTTANTATADEKSKPSRQRPAAKAAVAAPARGKRGAVAAAPQPPAKQTRSRSQSDLSEASGTSTGTTIVAKKAAPARKGIMGKMAGMATSAGRARAAAAKKEAEPAADTGRRVLRARK